LTSASRFSAASAGVSPMLSPERSFSLS